MDRIKLLVSVSAPLLRKVPSETRSAATSAIDIVMNPGSLTSSRLNLAHPERAIAAAAICAATKIIKFFFILFLTFLMLLQAKVFFAREEVFRIWKKLHLAEKLFLFSKNLLCIA